jgi:hypothetical protein
MNPLQQKDTSERQDDHPKQNQECSNHSNPGDQTAISDTNLGMISMEDHEDTVKRIQEKHEATVKRMQLEIERLKDFVKSDNEETKDTKRDVEEITTDIPNRSGESQGNRKRPKNEPTAKKYDAKWQTRYNELKEFHETHGHCNVPTNDDNYKELSKW